MRALNDHDNSIFEIFMLIQVWHTPSENVKDVIQQCHL